MRGRRPRLPGNPPPDEGPSGGATDPAFEVEASARQRRAFHAVSEPIPTPPIRTVLVDLATELERGFWDEPLWLPVGATLEGGDELWEVVSVRLSLPVAAAGRPGRPVLYLYARHVEA